MFNKKVLWSTAGFGLGGLLWGLEAYRGTVGAGEAFTNPFSYVLGAVALAVLGGHALAYATKPSGVSFGWKTCFGCLAGTRTIKLIGLGLVGWIVAFFVPMVWTDILFLYGGALIPFFLAFLIIPLDLIGLGEVVNIALEPSLMIGNFWIEFLIAGVIIGALYSLVLTSNIVKTALWTGIGFAIVAIIGPILGNLIGNLFGSLLVSYMVTFLVIGKVFGFALGKGITHNSP